MKSGLNEILFYVVFTLPVIRYFLLQFLDNRSSMKRSEKLKKYVEKELSGIRVSGRAEEEQLAYTLRNIQDEMFTYRASCPPVPNGIQLIMKPKNERIYVDYFETNLEGAAPSEVILLSSGVGFTYAGAHPINNSWLPECQRKPIVTFASDG